MISTEQRIVLKKVLKGYYIEDVLLKLKEKGIKTQTGTEYSDKMISHIFNGRYENQDIEMCILEVYQERKQQQDKWEDKKNDMLGLNPDTNKKPKRNKKSGENGSKSS